MTKALLLTLFVGVFFLIGLFLPKLFKKKEKLILITTAITFLIMVYLICFDLFPETVEIYKSLESNSSFLILLIASVTGFFSLKILDIFIPEHHHEHCEEKDNIQEHNAHLFHIGYITAISLILHNILEGISIYATALGNLKLGWMMALTVGFHNLPLGIEIAINLEARKEKKVEKIGISLLLILSSFLGAFCLFLLKKELTLLVKGILLCLTLGMLFYISFFELFPELKRNKRKKEIKMGFLLGLILITILFVL